MARLKFRNFHCGGTIINEHTVVTAAHCCTGFDSYPNYVKVTIGENNIEIEEDGEFSNRGIEIIIHPGWNRRTLENDICLVKFWVYILYFAEKHIL